MESVIHDIFNKNRHINVVLFHVDRWQKKRKPSLSFYMSDDTLHVALGKYSFKVKNKDIRTTLMATACCSSVFIVYIE